MMYKILFLLFVSCLANHHSFANDDNPKEPPKPVPHQGVFCKGLLNDVEPSFESLNAPRSGFVHDTTKYRYGGVKADTCVSNQGGYGSCWAHAGLTFFEQRVFLKTGKYIELSEDYLIAQKLIHQAIIAAKQDQGYVSSGGIAGYNAGMDVSALSELYGVLPAEAWKPLIPFSEWRSPFSKLEFHLNVAVHNARLDRKSGKFDEKAFRAQLTDIVQTYVGKWPKSFEFEGAKYSPVTFFKRPEFRRNTGSGSMVLRKGLAVQDFSVEYIAKRIREHIDLLREPVVVSLQSVRTFQNYDQGIWSVNAFCQYTVSLENTEMCGLIKNLALQGDSANTHAVNIVDYEVDAQGNIVKFLALNSWGKDAGDQGYLHIYWDYFKMFVNNAAVYAYTQNPNPSRDGVNPKILKIFDENKDNPEQFLKSLQKYDSSALDFIFGKNASPLSDQDLLFLLSTIPLGQKIGASNLWKNILRNLKHSWQFEHSVDEVKGWGPADVAILYELLSRVKEISSPELGYEIEEATELLVESSYYWENYASGFKDDVLDLFKKTVRKKIQTNRAPQKRSP